MQNNGDSRMDKFEKRRKNTKLINYSLVFASVLALFLLGLWIFGGGDDEAAENIDTDTEDESFFLEIQEEDDETNNVSLVDEEDTGEVVNEDSQDADESNQEAITTEVVHSDDENVIEAITGNWPPSGTNQTGPHTTNYENESADRIEIKQAVSMVTGIPESEMIEWWIENGGSPQKVIATVSDKAETETYRVYLDWVDEEGWQPTRMETLAVNDKK